MSSATDELQKIFKTLSDPTRVRILRLLESEELMVQELMEVLGMAQSRVSRHLAILREARLLVDRRDGTYVFYRFAPPASGAWHDTWEVVRRSLANDPTARRDEAALERVIEARGARARSFFDAVGPEWDALRKVFDDDVLRARAIARLVDPGLRVADIGTGTGVLALELARLGLDVVGVDRSRRMLDTARAKIEAEGLARVELREGDASRLPIEDASVDAALAHMVLQYLPQPAEAVREMARIVRAGGVVVIVDFVRHDQEWMRHELGVQWQGFSPDEVEGWLAASGLARANVQVHDPRARGRDLPATFIASARRA
ncbi:MAG: metalloregulator ArsR/SmtB family transcription factor [Myxococcota bacterium]|nr:metalloregulator ArsR/SmtB family transcription factor [Myxococcales bacterium]